MRSGWMILMAAAAYAVAPQAASADDAEVQEQLRQMQERLMLLEDRLHTTTDQLEAATEQVNEQKQVMSNAGLQVDEAGASGIDSFLQSLEIGGWVNISYWHNFNDPTNGEAAGAGALTALPASLNANTGNAATAAGATTGLAFSGFFNPTNPDSQGFSFDQLWFELERPVSPEQRSGFRADITVGKIADILGNRGNVGARNGRSDDDIYIHQANIQYLAPVPHVGDVKLTLGKFSTLLGYEVAQASYNYNISRDVLWGLFQPVDHLGFLMSGQLDRRYHFLGVEGVIDWDFGVVNGFSADDPDLNHAKTWTGRVRMTGEAWSIAFAGIHGAEDGGRLDNAGCPGFTIAARSIPCASIDPTNVGIGGSESEKVTLIDLIMTWDPFTDLNLWLNMNRMWVNPDGADPDAWGITIGGHYTVNERIGVTLRTSFAQWEDPGGSLLGFTNLGLPFAADANPGACPGGAAQCFFGTDADILSITGTVHYQLTDQIKVRGEIRWDDIEIFGRRGNTGLTATDQLFNERTAQAAGNVRGGDSDQFVAGVDVLYEF